MTNPTNQASGVAEPDDERVEQAAAAARRAYFGASRYPVTFANIQPDAQEVWRNVARAALATKPAAPAEVVVAPLLRDLSAFFAGPAKIAPTDENAKAAELWKRIDAALRTPAQAPSTGAGAVAVVNGSDMMIGREYRSIAFLPGVEACAIPVGSRLYLASPPVVQPASPAVEVASEPVARLFVSMERHDMGQSLAPPPPPFRFVQARALPAADGLPVGEYNLCLATPPAPAAVTEGPMTVIEAVEYAKRTLERIALSIGTSTTAENERSWRSAADMAMRSIEWALAHATPHPAVAVPGSLTDALNAVSTLGDTIGKMLIEGKVRTRTGEDHQRWKAMQKTWDALMGQVASAIATTSTAAPGATPKGGE